MPSEGPGQPCLFGLVMAAHLASLLARLLCSQCLFLADSSHYQHLSISAAASPSCITLWGQPTGIPTCYTLAWSPRSSFEIWVKSLLTPKSHNSSFLQNQHRMDDAKVSSQLRQQLGNLGPRLNSLRMPRWQNSIPGPVSEQEALTVF